MAVIFTFHLSIFILQQNNIEDSPSKYFEPVEGKNARYNQGGFRRNPNSFGLYDNTYDDEDTLQNGGGSGMMFEEFPGDFYSSPLKANNDIHASPLKANNDIHSSPLKANNDAIMKNNDAIMNNLRYEIPVHVEEISCVCEAWTGHWKRTQRYPDLTCTEVNR